MTPFEYVVVALLVLDCAIGLSKLGERPYLDELSPAKFRIVVGGIVLVLLAIFNFVRTLIER